MTIKSPLPSEVTTKVPAVSPLDARLTFETFMVGRSNTLAAAAARRSHAQ